MKKLLHYAFAALAFVACTQNDIEEFAANRADVPETLTVGFEGSDTRIQLNEAQKTVWNAGDEVSVFYNSNFNQKWQYQGEDGERHGELTPIQDGEGDESFEGVVAIYPYNESYSLDAENLFITASIPAVQHYAEGSYGVGDNVMVAYSENNNIVLKSVCGWLKVQLTGDGEKVESLILRGNNGEQVAGQVFINAKDTSSTFCECDAATTEITLECDSEVVLSENATTFYFAVLPQTFEGGVTVVVECNGYEPMTLTTTAKLVIERNYIKPMASVEHDAEPATTNNKIYYTATAKIEAYSYYPWTFDTFGANIVYHEWNSTTGEGVIIFDDSVTTIGYAAFAYCETLTSITIPDGVTTTEYAAFALCKNLTNITIPNSVTSLGEMAFYECDKLETVTIPNSVTTIGPSAFWDCDGLTSVIIPYGVTVIENETFYGCNSLTSITIPDSVTTIGELAFYWCKNLTSVTIPDSVTTIEDYAFEECSALTNIIIPDSVTTIEDYVFAWCNNLISATIGKGVTALGYGAFYHCDNLISVYCKATTPPTANVDTTSWGYWEAFSYNDSFREIYVPAKSLEAYKSAPGWKLYNDSIFGYDF